MAKDLPRELWLEIFKHFVVSYGVMELYKYRKVCKAWSELITVVLIDKLTSMITRIKYYYQIIRGLSNNTEEEIETNPSPPSAPPSSPPSSSPPSSPPPSTSSPISMNSYISYNYNIESFEYNFITTIENDKIDKIEAEKLQYEFYTIFHVIYEILNIGSIKRIREYFIKNYWLNVEENIVKEDSKWYQKVSIRGDKLLPYIDYFDAINNLIGYFSQ